MLGLPPGTAPVSVNRLCSGWPLMKAKGSKLFVVCHMTYVTMIILVGVHGLTLGSALPRPCNSSSTKVVK